MTRRRFWLWAGGAVLAIICFVAGLLYWRGQKPFDAATWRACRDHKGTDRLKMVRDLLRNHSPIGMYAGDVITLLGPADVEEPDAFIYWLGPESPYMAFEDRWLRLECKNDVVTSTDVYFD